MGATSTILFAPTMEELEKRTREWFKQVKKMELYEHMGWDPIRVQATENGHQIFLRAHT